jgi:hypothetical protein
MLAVFVFKHKEVSFILLKNNELGVIVLQYLLYLINWLINEMVEFERFVFLSC